MKNICFNSIFELLEMFKDEQSCINFLEQIRWKGNVISPFDSDSKVYKCKNNMYHCRSTGKYFNAKTGTLFHGSHLPLQKWIMAIYLILSDKKGITSSDLAGKIKVTQKTAWFVLHRIRNSFGVDELRKLFGIVEADESFIGGKNKNRHRNKKVKNSQGRSCIDKTPVLGLLEREMYFTTDRQHKIIPGRIVQEKTIISPGYIYCSVMENTGSDQIQPIVLRMVRRGSTLMTDEWKGYNGMSAHYDHQRVNHKSGRYAIGDTSSNGIENFWSGFKCGIIGNYSCVSRKHLQKYADEFSFRYNTKNISVGERISVFLENIEHRLTYKELTNAQKDK